MRLDNYHSLVQLHKMLLVKLLVLGVLTNTQVAYDCKFGSQTLALLMIRVRKAHTRRVWEPE